MRCDYIAEGVIKASKELEMSIPLIVRLKGTKEAEAKQYVITLFRPIELTVYLPSSQIDQGVRT